MSAKRAAASGRTLVTLRTSHDAADRTGLLPSWSRAPSGGDFDGIQAGAHRTDQRGQEQPALPHRRGQRQKIQLRQERRGRHQRITHATGQLVHTQPVVQIHGPPPHGRCVKAQAGQPDHHARRQLLLVEVGVPQEVRSLDNGFRSTTVRPQAPPDRVAKARNTNTQHRLARMTRRHRAGDIRGVTEPNQRMVHGVGQRTGVDGGAVDRLARGHCPTLLDPTTWVRASRAGRRAARRCRRSRRAGSGGGRRPGTARRPRSRGTG